MMQTQQLLAAVQAQANLANSGPPSLMQGQPNQGFSRQGGRNLNQRNYQDRYSRNDRPHYGAQRHRDDRKRKSSPPRNPISKRERRENNSQPTRLVKTEFHKFSYAGYHKTALFMLCQNLQLLLTGKLLFSYIRS